MGLQQEDQSRREARPPIPPRALPPTNGSSACFIAWRCLTDGGSAAARRELPEYRAAAARASNPAPGGGRPQPRHAPHAGGQLQPLVRQPPFTTARAARTPGSEDVQVTGTMEETCPATGLRCSPRTPRRRSRGPAQRRAPHAPRKPRRRRQRRLPTHTTGGATYQLPRTTNPRGRPRHTHWPRRPAGVEPRPQQANSSLRERGALAGCLTDRGSAAAARAPP
jgi:hypothetical protein